MRTASCSCGQLQVHCEGEPIRVSMCHCLACQRRTGSAFAIQARWPRERVRIEGESRVYALVGDAGGTARFQFCGTCGATVYYTIDQLPEVIAVPVGAFADPAFPPPRISVYNARRHPWAAMPSLEIENHD